jgi:hypothetical protein
MVDAGNGVIKHRFLLASLTGGPPVTATLDDIKFGFEKPDQLSVIARHGWCLLYNLSPARSK